MKKILIFGSIAAAIVITAVLVWPKKKPCPCLSAQNPDAAIDNLSETELKNQIAALSQGYDLAGKSLEELRSLLKSLVKNG